jgi:hypothetical protein
MDNLFTLQAKSILNKLDLKSLELHFQSTICPIRTQYLKHDYARQDFKVIYDQFNF